MAARGYQSHANVGEKKKLRVATIYFVQHEKIIFLPSTKFCAAVPTAKITQSRVKEHVTD